MTDDTHRNVGAACRLIVRRRADARTCSATPVATPLGGSLCPDCFGVEEIEAVRVSEVAYLPGTSGNLIHRVPADRLCPHCEERVAVQHFPSEVRNCPQAPDPDAGEQATLGEAEP